MEPDAFFRHEWAAVGGPEIEVRVAVEIEDGGVPRFRFDAVRDEDVDVIDAGPGIWALRLSAGPDGLGVGEFADAEMGEFPAVAALLDAAYGGSGVRCGKAVDEDAAGF